MKRLVSSLKIKKATDNNLDSFYDDLTIMIIMLKDMEDPNKIIIPHLQMYGCWFTNIIDNKRKII